MRIKALFGIVCFFTSALNAQTTYYVNNLSGLDSNSGVTADSAKMSIQSAVDAASSGDTISVSATGQLYGGMGVVSGKTLMFAASGGVPEMAGLTIHQPSLEYEVRLAATFKVDSVVFVNGLIVTGNDTLIMNQGEGYATQGFDRSQVTGGRISHVVGNVKKVMRGIINEFPVGSYQYYRPASLFFALGEESHIGVTINHSPKSPSGSVGLPIVGDDSSGINIVRYPDFYWQVATDSTIASTVNYGIEFTAEGFTDYNFQSDLHLIRRDGGPADSSNTWLFHGYPYDIYSIDSVVTVSGAISAGGLSPDGTIFTYGMKSRLVVSNPFIIPWLPEKNQTFRLSLRNPPLITGNIGEVSYSVTTDNPTIATVTIIDDTLIVKSIRPGVTIIRVRATDSYDGRFITYAVLFSNVLVYVQDNSYAPASFTLSQNYPNPFNPSTVIKFALPERQFVNLTIYDMLGNEIETLVNEQLNPGTFRVNWDAGNKAAGVYLYRLRASEFVETKKLIILK